MKNRLFAYGENGGLRVMLNAALAAVGKASVEFVPMFSCVRS